jgi:nicotinamidase/pyrazinamidase
MNLTWKPTKMSKLDIHVVGIDQQNDFSDIPAELLPVDPTNPDERIKPALAVPGAHLDVLRFSEMLNRGRRGIQRITVTLDSHHRIGVERPAMWRNADGTVVAPFTVISHADLLAGKYVPANPVWLPRMLGYTKDLEAAGRYELRVWPAHAEEGTWGHNIHASLLAACHAWEEDNLANVQKVRKGTNPWTEHFSALMAEVPDAADESTQLNRALLETFETSDLVVFAGEAGSHCFKSTLEHVVAFGDASLCSKMVILTDCVSPIPGFEAQYDQFLSSMMSAGVQLATSAELVGELIANGRR